MTKLIISQYGGFVNRTAIIKSPFSLKSYVELKIYIYNIAMRAKIIYTLTIVYNLIMQRKKEI